MRVIVGLSGGVDSAVSAALLKRAGADVVGAFIKTWHPDWLEDKCGWRQERRDAMRVAAHLQIPFVTVNLEKEYKREVADYMISEYKAGHTPNPDVMCNKKIKFGAFLRRALAMGADCIATGHYAQIEHYEIENSVQIVNCKLKIGVDDSKDQSYFLWTLNQDQLSKTIFPVGHLMKREVRKLAKKFKLPVSDKRDSQGICFLGNVDMKDFLSYYIKTKPGEVRNEKGEVIGKHDGAILYTLGQNWPHSVKTSRGQFQHLYVMAKDVGTNTLTVGEKSKHTHATRSRSVCMLENINWISGEPKEDKTYEAQIRYHGEKFTCQIKLNVPDSKLAKIKFDKPVLVAPGQSIVLYKGDICLGGGIAA